MGLASRAGPLVSLEGDTTMGYYVSTEDVDVFVPAADAEAALMMLDAMGLSGIDSGEMAPVGALAEALGNNGFDVSESDSGVRINWYNDKSCEEGSVLVALAPYVADGSFMEWRGEEGERWRDVVRGGTVVHQFVESVNWADRGHTDPPTFDTFLPVTCRASLTDVATGYIVCRGLMTPGQIESIASALFKGVYFRPALIGLPGLESDCAPDRWHELDVDAIQTVAAGELLSGSENALEGGSAAGFVDKMRAAGEVGWQEAVSISG